MNKFPPKPQKGQVRNLQSYYIQKVEIFTEKYKNNSQKKVKNNYTNENKPGTSAKMWWEVSDHKGRNKADNKL